MHYMMEAYAADVLRCNGYGNRDSVEKAENDEMEDFKSVNRNMEYNSVVEIRGKISWEIYRSRDIRLSFW